MVAERAIESAPKGASWFVWCAALAITSAMIGAQWDISWHRSIGRDTFWTTPHLAIQLCAVIAGISSAWLILATTFGRRSASSTVSMWGFRGPLGAFLAAWGGVAMLTSAPFDDWWHNSYGLDVRILSPPHSLLAAGINAIIAGSLVLALAERNRAPRGTAARAQLDGVALYMGGVMLVLFMTFIMEETGRARMHGSGFYRVICMVVPVVLSGLARASGRRFAMTAITGVYSMVFLGLIWVLPLFPAEPKLGPVYHPVTCFIPPSFPILLLFPALALDLLRPRTEKLGIWTRSLVEAVIFLVVLVAVQWPFAIFLMSKASMNPIFGTIYFDFSTPSTSFEFRRLFHSGDRSAGAFAMGMAIAVGFGFLSTRLGLAWGAAVARVKR